MVFRPLLHGGLGSSILHLPTNFCRSSSLGGQRIVYPTKAGSIPVRGARANDSNIQRLLVSMGGIETIAKSESSLLREIQARCRDLTVNQWLGEFDSHTRSQKFGLLV